AQAAKEIAALPSGSQLARKLAHLVQFPSDSDEDLNDLAKVASYFVEASGRRSLREILHETFNQDFKPHKIHEHLAEIDRPLLIVTTNYDDLTERAFKERGRPFDLVIHPTDREDMAGAVLWWKDGAKEPVAEAPNTLPMIERLKTMTVIYKMHGTVVRPWYKGEAEADEDRPYRQDSYVITEDDYITFINRMTQQAAVPTQFMSYFSARQFLFLGYGLRDWNMRVVLRKIDDVLKIQGAGGHEDSEERNPSWAIQYKPSALESKLWSRRGIDIYDKEINEFVDQLRKA
ncbi:MAG: SIR2 family protein, partial [Pyrinomonadaceae bacterium]